MNKNIFCGYSILQSHLDGSNEGSQQKFRWNIMPSAVDNFCGWCTVHIMVVKFGVPKNQKVYWYDYHVKNLIKPG